MIGGGLMFPEATRILIVDDMSTMCELLKAHLRRMGYKSIVEGQDGQQGYQLLVSAKTAGHPFHLVISDWNMPKMNGLEFLKAVRQVGNWKELPFILLTTESEKEKVLEAVVGGVSQYIVKPVSEKILQEKMRLTWEKHAATLEKTSFD